MVLYDCSNLFRFWNCPLCILRNLFSTKTFILVKSVVIFSFIHFFLFCHNSLAALLHAACSDRRDLNVARFPYSFLIALLGRDLAVAATNYDAENPAF